MAVGLACGLIAYDAGHEANADTWLPLPAASLEVVSGSALDLSELAGPRSAGSLGPIQASHGGAFLEFANLPGRPVHLNCSQASFYLASGGIPDKTEVMRLVRQLKFGGYDAVRVPFMDAILMGGRQGDYDYDPVLLDRFYFFLSEAKKAGIYWIIDMQSSPNGALGNVSATSMGAGL